MTGRVGQGGRITGMVGTSSGHDGAEASFHMIGNRNSTTASQAFCGRHSGAGAQHASPESILPRRGYGFRARRFAAPRNDF
jgi:hypothetical protein